MRAVAVLSSVAVLAGSGWGWHLLGVAEASVHRGDALPTEGNTDVNGAEHAGQEMNLLLVGMDSRAGLSTAQEDANSTGGSDGELNTDTMILVHVPADGSGVSFVSLPRDTYVPIPGYGEGKLNSAYADAFGATDGDAQARDAAGMGLLVQTASQFTGLQIDHYAEVDLAGFLQLSSIVGGVQVDLCQATSDSYSGASFPAGVQTIQPDQALSFVRQRHGLPQGDIDRTIRQQVYIAGMLRNLLSTDVLLDPAAQQRIVAQVGDSVTLDRDLDVGDLVGQLQGIRPADLTFQTVPGLVNARVHGSDVLEPPAADAVHAFFADLGRPAAATPSATPSAAAGGTAAGGTATATAPPSSTVPATVAPPAATSGDYDTPQRTAGDTSCID
ncbi:LCP family protein [Klenkia sp. PcliD-1-E]|uniref:LCP family protein n=1 Tax=Klenkia sp. PcliD-1-E TaxID=2954492 RepID=UPI00209857D6|nr:LCP family protein [Klenkia sp. PcliD-1-E]MCO7221283.1 LCP family protein [Klenkia sp. PcliD-1-E]